MTSFDVNGEDIADCEDGKEFASYIADAPPRYAKRCYRFLVRFLQENAGWLCTVRSRIVAHDSKPACTRQTRLPGSCALLLYEAGLCLVCSCVDVSFVLRIFAAVPAAPLSVTMNKESTDASTSVSKSTVLEVTILRACGSGLRSGWSEV